MSWSVSKSSDTLQYEKVGREVLPEMEHSRSSLLSSSRIEEKVINIDLLESEENEAAKVKGVNKLTPGT